MKITFPLVTLVLCASVPAFAVPVSVTVVGPDDKPIPNAKLSVLPGALFSTDMKEARPQNGVGGVFNWEFDGQFGPIDESFETALKNTAIVRIKAAAPGMVSETRVLRGAQTTIHLWPARVWGGVLLDQNQKPVAGVTLNLKEVHPPDVAAAEGRFASFLNPALAVEDTLTQTDANGRWDFLGMPARGSAELEIDAPRYATRKLSLSIGEGDAAPIVVQEGAQIIGTVRTPDGSPLVGATVLAGANFDSRAVTGADGRFTISGVAAGESSLDLIPNSSAQYKADGVPAFLFERQPRIKVEAGKTLDVGEIKAQSGVLVTARVVSAATKQPLAKADLRGGISQQTAPKFGADGQFQVRVLTQPTDSRFDAPRIESDGYLDYLLPPETFLTTKTTLDLGTIEMKSGNAARGTVRIEGGGDLGRLPTIYLKRNQKNEYLHAGENGVFESQALEAGTYTVSVSGGKDWKLVSPPELVVPVAGQNAAPAAIVVKRLTPYAPLVREVRGQLRDAQGAPIAGAQVRAGFKREDYGFFSDATSTSDAQGNFVVKNPSGNAIAVEWDGATSPSYLIGGEPKIEVRDGIATVAGLTAKKRGAIFSGRVVMADGQPAAGAWVGVVEARDYALVKTGADGSFGLLDVPLENFTLIAARERDWTQLATQSDKSGVTLKLAAAPARPDAASLREQLVGIKSGVSWDEILTNWDVLGTPLVERFLWRNGPPDAQVVALFGGELARRDPAQLLKRAPELRAATAGESLDDLDAQINLTRAQIGDPDQRALAAAWLDEQKAVKREINARSVAQLLQMATVARQLKREDADQLLDYAAALSAQSGNNAGITAKSWGAPLAHLGYDATARFVEGRKAPAEFTMWAYVGPALAQSGDISGARKALARLQQLALNPEIAGADTLNAFEFSNRMDDARAALARALVTTDAAGALEMATQVGDINARAQALVGVAASALPLGKPDVAEKAVRAASKIPNIKAEPLALAASLGAQIRPQLGAELFSNARDTIETSQSPGSWTSIGPWALNYAPTDAALSRVLIEREWNWRLAAAIKNKAELISADASALTELARGMAVIDIERAREMQATADASELQAVNRKASPFGLVAVALANEQRAKLGLDAQF